MTADDDPAARFRKPTPEQAPPAPAAPAPQSASRPQTLARLLEETLTAPLRLGSLFDELALEPAPGYGIMALNLVIYWAAMLGLNLLHVAIVRPQSLRYPPELIAAVGAGGLLAVLVGGCFMAGAVEAAAVASGASFDYARSFQIVSLLSALAPLQAALNWLPSAWPVPLLWGALACAAALERLHRAPPAGARVAVAALTAAGLFTVWTARSAVERSLARSEAVEQGAAQLRDMAAQIQQLQQSPQPATPGQAPAAGSSLDFLRVGAVPPGGQPSQQQVDQIKDSAANMMKAVQPVLNDPNLAKNLPPDQAAMLKQVTGLLSQVQGNLQTGQKLDAQQMMAQLQQLQQMQRSGKTMTLEEQQKMLQQLMQSTGQTPPQGPAPQP